MAAPVSTNGLSKEVVLTGEQTGKPLTWRTLYAELGQLQDGDREAITTRL
jgi:hypothetical protein